MNIAPGRMDIENNLPPPPQPNTVRGANVAPGLTSIINATQRLYPNQKNPLQVTAVMKYWLGGPDPLDYINMYSNTGCQDGEPHWHYVSCGLSDLHGDARVHLPAPSPDHPSGYGFELTFRLKREPDQNQPPTWPAALLNSISKYVFESENKLVPGDHINWGKSLDGSLPNLRHLLVSEDPQLETLSTSLGKVHFLQLVGITDAELKAVQRWNGPGISKLLKSSVETGGSLLITIPYRPCLFDIKPEARQLVDMGISQEGSNLCGMAAMISWTEPEMAKIKESKQSIQESALNNWESLARQCDRLIETNCGQPNRVSFPKSISLACNLETAKFLPLCIQGRLKHGYHFTLKSIVKETAVTFVVSQVAGTLVSPEKPFAAQGEWLQVLIKDSFLDEFYSRMVDIENNLVLPYTFQWPDQRISLTVFNDDAEMLQAIPN